MAKQYKVKDINNNGKIDGWEQGKYDAINKSATKMGYAMKMGSKENYSPTNFKTKDAMLMAQSPMMMTDPNKLKGVTGTANKPKDPEMNLNKFNEQREQIKKNIEFGIDKIDKTITSDSLTRVLQSGKPSNKALEEYKMSRNTLKNIKNQVPSQKAQNELNAEYKLLTKNLKNIK